VRKCAPLNVQAGLKAPKFRQRERPASRAACQVVRVDIELSRHDLPLTSPTSFVRSLHPCVERLSSSSVPKPHLRGSVSCDREAIPNQAGP